MATIATRPAGQGRTNRMLLLAAAALGLLTAVLVVSYLSKQGRERTALAGATVPVVVTQGDIGQGSTISADLITLKLVPHDIATSSAFADTKQVVGRRARYAVPAGAQVLPSMLVEPSADGALSYVVPSGMRAVAVATSDVIASGDHILPGDFVDVLAVMDTTKIVGGAPAASGEQAKGVFTVLQNVEVLAVAAQQEPGSQSGPVAKSQDANGSPSNPNKSVTLAVDPGQAQVLFLAESEGVIRLALRPFGDQGQQTIPAVLEPLASAAASSSH